MIDLIEFVRYYGYMYRLRGIFLELCIWFFDEICNGFFNIWGVFWGSYCCVLGVLIRLGNIDMILCWTLKNLNIKWYGGLLIECMEKVDFLSGKRVLKGKIVFII